MPNVATVELDFADVERRPVADDVRVTFRNFHLQSLDFRLELHQFPVAVKEVPAFPTGVWTVEVQPDHFRPKTFALSVPSGKKTTVAQTFFLHPSHAVAVLPRAAEVFGEPRWEPLAALLLRSTLEGQTGEALWEGLLENRLLAAGLLNLHARTRFVTFPDDRTVFSFFRELVEVRQDRIFVLADPALHPRVLAGTTTGLFDDANATLHEFPPGFETFGADPSFKTPQHAGNLQLTFARDAAGTVMVDADVDERKGIEHAFTVIGHIFSGGKTHPYDIHEILRHFYPTMDLGYELALA